MTLALPIECLENRESRISKVQSHCIHLYIEFFLLAKLSKLSQTKIHVKETCKGISVPGRGMFQLRLHAC